MKRSRIDRSVSGRGSSHTTSLDKIEALSRTHLIQSTRNTSTLERTDTVMDRMRHFAKQKQKTAFSEEADTVIRNLQHILKLLLWAEEEERGEGRKGMTSGETSETSSTHNNLLYQDEVKQIKRMLGVSHCVSINAKG